MAAETRIKLANIITRLPEEAVDSLKCYTKVVTGVANEI